ncbi:MAG: IS66 family transposase [Betaproteobacteria bacterium]
MGTSDISPIPERDEVAVLKSLIDEQRTLITAQASRITILEEQLKLATVKTFAPSSEKLSALAQLNLFNEAEALAGADAQSASEASATDEIEVPAHTRERGKRKPIDASLPRVRIEHDIPDERKTCACGCQLTRIGETTAEQFDIVPARAQVLQHVRFKYACRTCEGTSHDGPTVVTAPMPAQPIPKSNASPGLLAHITTMKYADGMPLYRVEGILARAKIHVSRTTQASWMIKSGDLVLPLINLLGETQLAYDVLQMDETSVQVLKENGRPATTKSFMWVRRGGPPGQRIILFDYAATRAGSVPMRILEEYKGYLQSDGYAAYDKPGRRDGVAHVGCLDHARRKFVEAVKAQHAAAGAERGLAPEALLVIRRIYAIEKLAREAQMSASLRHKLRHEKARPIWDELRAWLDRSLGAAPPSSYAGKAINYLAAEWPRLIRYLDDGRLEVSNVLCENAIRPFVVGRKAWLFSDTPAGATASARLYSIVETAKANGLEPYAYLKLVFEKLPQAVTLADVEALLPWNVAKPTR